MPLPPSRGGFEAANPPPETDLSEEDQKLMQFWINQLPRYRQAWPSEDEWPNGSWQPWKNVQPGMPDSYTTQMPHYDPEDGNGMGLPGYDLNTNSLPKGYGDATGRRPWPDRLDTFLNPYRSRGGL